MRIGLSATQKPIEEVAHFLTGNGRPDPVIVNIGHKRTLDLAVEVPASALGPVATNEMWDEIYDRLVELVEQHRSTLVFVNTRRLVGAHRASIWRSAWAKRMSPRITAACRASCGWPRKGN